MAPFQASASTSASPSVLQPGYVVKQDVPSSPSEPVRNAAVGSSRTDNSANASLMPNESQGQMKITA